MELCHNQIKGHSFIQREMLQTTLHHQWHQDFYLRGGRVGAKLIAWGDKRESILPTVQKARKLKYAC